MSTVETDPQSESASEPGTVAFFARRAKRITQADVFTAADVLLLEGERPTIDRVRMRIGRGSPNTINDHLDAWWLKLGTRLRDIPGREFPQLPEPVSQSLLHLWNQALDGARDALQSILAERERALVEREAALETTAHTLTERERAAGVRVTALEESLALAREQLVAANQRAQVLETSTQAREAECTRLGAQLQTLEAACVTLRDQLAAAALAHQAERARIDERHEAAESHWMRELDRARHEAKEHGHQLKALRTQVGSLHDERDHLREQLAQARAELKASVDLHTQLERHFQGVQPRTARQIGGAKRKGMPKRKRTP